MSSYGRFLSETGTALYLVQSPEQLGGNLIAPPQSRQKSRPHKIKKSIPQSNKTRPPVVGILLREWLNCPEISEDELGSLQLEQHEIITRHINKDFLESAVNGYFRFGTLIEYRPKDQNLIGRFSDIQEGSQNNYYTSRTSLYNYHNRINNCVVIGCDQGIQIEFFCNDYCSCSSVGGFSKKRALELRRKGNPDIGAFVVYDFVKLINALGGIIEERYPHLSLIYQEVKYDHKDQYWEIEGHDRDEIGSDSLSVWLSTAYVKSPDYAHEQEIRILIIDRSKPGGLSTENKFIEFTDPRIAESVIDYGKF